jgi:arginyl-tRNA--protein-N-Asp/Glu arginylyltransferase
MRSAELRYINEEFQAREVPPDKMDELWAAGWRHFGTQFYRYNIGFLGFDIRNVIPLRIRLSGFSPTKSQRRVLRKNEDLAVRIQPIEIDDFIEQIFHRHKQRYDHAVPDSIFDFLSRDPARVPCEANEIRVYDGERLIAVSYFDLGLRSVSGTYGMFEPTAAKRSLGIFTMLKEIEFAIDSGREFYYQGYCYEGRSFYDYKKRFRGNEAFDWNGGWENMEFKL